MDFAAQTVWAAALVFARVGALVLLIPGIGEAQVSPRIRLAFALLLTLVIAPLMIPRAPAIPDSFGAAGVLVVGEVLVGLVLGALARMTLSALGTAGSIAGLQTGMGFAMMVDPAQGQQGAIFGAFLSTMGIALIFAGELHHWFITAALSSYRTFPMAGGAPDFADTAQLGIAGFVSAFAVAIQMSAPLIVFGLIFNLALGILSKLAPQIQVFFILMPVQTLGGILIFMITAGAGMLVWLNHVEQVARMLN